MKLFISWSGIRSKQIALNFRQWLPTVIQSLKPWMSEVDIQKGADWNQTLTAELEGTSFGLFCLTRENLLSPWLFFEAGAIAKSLGTKRVYTYLVGLADKDIGWPLAQFQSTKASREDTFKMLSDMNKNLKEPLEPAVLQTAFDRGWPELEAALGQVPKEAATEETKSKTELMLEEILTYVRQQSSKDALPAFSGRLADALWREYLGQAAFRRESKPEEPEPAATPQPKKSGP